MSPTLSYCRNYLLRCARRNSLRWAGGEKKRFSMINGSFCDSLGGKSYRWWPFQRRLPSGRRPAPALGTRATSTSTSSCRGPLGRSMWRPRPGRPDAPGPAIFSSGSAISLRAYAFHLCGRRQRKKQAKTQSAHNRFSLSVSFSLGGSLIARY